MESNKELVTQAISLQILFDVWYLQGFALWRGSTQVHCLFFMCLYIKYTEMLFIYQVVSLLFHSVSCFRCLY